jgi:hypothetical protein
MIHVLSLHHIWRGFGRLLEHAAATILTRRFPGATGQQIAAAYVEI